MVDLNEGRLEAPRSKARYVAFGVAVAIVFGTLAGRLVQLQVAEGASYAARADAARTAEIAIVAPRGLVFDREGRPLIINVPAWVVQVRPADLPAEASRVSLELRRVAEVTGARYDTLRARLDGYHGSPHDLVTLVRDVDQRAALLLAEAAPTLPGVVVAVDPMRRYLGEDGRPDGLLLSGVLGYTGPISADELRARAELGYLIDDEVGKAGIEASFEDELRGTYGGQLVERNPDGSPGRVLRTLSQPVPGRNLVLTIDARMQRVATESLRWGLEAAGVEQGVTIVMNPQTGEILAMVSMPGYDSNKFATGISQADFAAYLDDPTRPLRNHAIADIYPPGSTFKLVTALAALEEGVTTPTQRWPTYGCFQIPGAPAGQCLYDWNHRGFGPLDIRNAFAISSDTFFYQMALGSGVDAMEHWAHELGFGERSGIDLPGEAAGTVISRAWARALGHEDVYSGELAQAGIGQNAIAVTPLQLLNAYAAVANGGHLMRPMLVRGEADADGDLIRTYPPEVIREIAADPSHLELIRIGARLVITSGHAYNIRRLDLPGALSGKTGTAQFGTANAQGGLPFHSWFVAYLPSEEGATDAELAVITFTYSAVVKGNVSLEVVKYFLQQWYALDQDLRLNPYNFSRLTAD